MTASPRFRRMRWVALGWVAVWTPTYARSYDPANFLFLCDLAVLLTALGLWRGSALLLSSQAVGSIVVDLFWDVDVVSRLALGRHLIGGTEYMYDNHLPLFVRLLSLFHVALPVVLLWSLRHVGYDRRGIRMQSAIALAATLLGRVVAGPTANINGAWADPLFKRVWGPAPVHLAVVACGLIAIVYVPTHLVLARLYRPPAEPVHLHRALPAGSPWL